MANSVDSDKTPCLMSDLGVHCLLRPVCSITWSKYGNLTNLNSLRDHRGSAPEFQSTAIVTYHNQQLFSALPNRPCKRFSNICNQHIFPHLSKSNFQVYIHYSIRNLLKQYPVKPMLSKVLREKTKHGCLTLKATRKICSRRHSDFFFFSEKTSLEISCESSAKQTIHMKYQDLFSLKNKKKRKILSSVAVVIGALRVKKVA